MNEVNIENSKFKIDEGLDVAEWKEKVNTWKLNLNKEKSERTKVYKKRRDFFEGEQAKYTNIVGLTRREKKGHTNAVYNLVGKMAIKIYFALGNQPPHFVLKPLLKLDKKEAIKAQSVEDFINRVIWQNKFWKMGYKRGVMNQTVLANYAIMVYPDFEKQMIRIVNLEKMENLMVGWRGDDATEYDYTIYEEDRSTESIKKEFGVVSKPYRSANPNELETNSGHTDPYNTMEGSRSDSNPSQPSGKTDIPVSKFTDVWTDEYNIILVNDEVVQLTKHDFGFNPVIIGRNIHNPGKPWDISDLDYLMDPQIEFNEGNNDVRDFLRTGVNQKYNAHNMDDFDPESLKTGSGQVIYTNGDETFTPIPVNVNTFPVDTHLQRVEKTMHKLGIPEVTFGAGSTAGVSGRARAIDFQSFVDTIIDKQQSWELVLEEVSERVQILGNKFFAPKIGDNFFLGPSGEFEVREINFDWSEVLPTTQSDKQVDVINKRNARMISLETALSEMGYQDPSAEIEKIKEEYNDPKLAPILSNKVDVLEGVVEAAVRARMTEAEETAQITGGVPGADGQNTNGQAAGERPQLTQGQNQEFKMPMAQPGSQRAFSTPGGQVANDIQNAAAQ